MIFKVYTTSTCITEYEVEASKEKEAVEKFQNGEYETSVALDFKNETITKVKSPEK